MTHDNKEHRVKFVQELSNYLKCRICKKCYTDPVINGCVSCGHTFCRECALYLEKCPLDSSSCDEDKLVVNRQVVDQINDLLVYCPLGLIQENSEWVVDLNGCPEKITLGSVDDHKKECQFTPVFCPNSQNCGMFRRQDLNGHIECCCHSSCPNYTNGCEYKGITSSMATHLKSCSYNESTSCNVELLSRTRSLEKANTSLQEEVHFLKDKLSSLDSAKHELSSQLSICIGSISTLQQKVDNLQSTVEQLLLNPSRHSSTTKNDSMTGSNNRLSNPFSSTPYSPSHSSKVENWEMPFQFKCIGTLRGHQDVVWSLTIYHGKLYSAGTDAIIKLWDLDTLSKGCIGNLQGHKKRIHCSCAGGGYLYTGGDDLSIKQWNVMTGAQPLVTENAHDNTICSMVLHGENLFTSSFALIKVWNCTNLTLIHSISGLHHWIRAMILSPRKECLYSGSHNLINIIDTTTFESVDQINHDLGPIYSLAVTSVYIIAGTFDQNIQLFDAKTRMKVFKLEGHFGAVTSLVTSPSGRFLFSGSHDNNVQMWNLETCLPYQTLSRHQGSVNSIALYGNILLSGSEDREIKVYRYFQSPFQ